MNTITKHPNVPTGQAYGRPTLWTQELGLREKATRSGPWAVWVWLQLGWAGLNKAVASLWGRGDSLVTPAE